MTYCKLSHSGLYVGTTGSVRQCCIQKSTDSTVITNWADIDSLSKMYIDDKWLSKVRSDLDNGIQNSACSKCWRAEHSKLLSKRQRVNSNAQYSDQTDITTVDLRLSNKCNLQCKMCYPGASDQIAKLALELKENGVHTDLLNTMGESIYNVDHLLTMVTDLPNLKYLRLAGGEPFIMPEVEEMLFKLVEMGKTDITIDFITNCTSAKSKIIEVLEKFKSVQLQYSIDAIGDDLEYQRYPASWEKIETNFKKFYNSKCEVNLTPCITLLNLVNLHEFIHWTEQFPKSKVEFNEVDDMTFLDFRLVPLSARSDLTEFLAGYSMKNNLKPNWHLFAKRMVHEVREPNDIEIEKLTHYALDIWDYKCRINFLHKYPYMDFMIK